MPLMIYTQYTKPEGMIKFDDLVLSAKRKGIKCLAMTDHGNFSGITEFYSKCLDSGIKPVIGLDFFCKLRNNKFIRSILYIKNYDGYKNVLKIVEKLNSIGKSYYCNLEDLSDLKYCYFSISLYKIDQLSEELLIESDFKIVSNEINTLNLEQEDIFYHILYDDDSYNNEITTQLVKFQKEENVQLLGCNPVYYLDEGNHKIKEFTLRLSGDRSSEKHFRKQFLESTEIFREEFPVSSIENRDKIFNTCHFIVEDLPIKFPELKLQEKIDFSYFETLKEQIFRILSDKKEELKNIISEELAYIRKHNIADIILFLIEVKAEFITKYDQHLFFSGFVNDLHLAYILNLTLCSPVFSSADYHRAVLANKKLHPQITVVVSPENRSNLFEYMSGRFPKNSICFLSEYTKWHFTTILSSLEKEFKIERSLVEVINKYYNKNYRSTGQLLDILNIKEVDEELKKYPDQKEYLLMSIYLDDVFKNYNTNTNQLVISNDNIKKVLPINSKNADSDINCSFYNMHTAKHFGVWNINIESNNYLEIRKYFKLGPLDQSNLTDLSKELVEKIKKDDLSMIPYFNYNHNREKFLEISNNQFCNLIIYLESGRTNLNFITNRPASELPNKRFKKELDITRGFIVFKEQFYFICDKLFSAKDLSVLKRRLLESMSVIQFNSILNQIAEKKNYSEKCDFLRSAFQPTVFYSSLSDVSVKVIIASRMLELKKNNEKEFTKYIFLREVNSGNDWRKYIKEMQKTGFTFNKISIANTTLKAFCKDLNIFLPLYCIKGISEKVSTHIYEYLNNSEINSFQDFLERSDKTVIKHNIIDILVKIGFFDLFNSNRKELENLNNDYFKSIKKDDSPQMELFEVSGIAMETDSISDYTFEEKRNFEEEYTGIIFSHSNKCECDLCGFLKVKEGQNIIIDKTIYSEYNFTLYISLEKDDNFIISELSGFLYDEGNCEVEIFFSDTKDIIKLNKFIQLDDITVYKLNRSLKDIPFYIEIK